MINELFSIFVDYITWFAFKVQPARVSVNRHKYTSPVESMLLASHTSCKQRSSRNSLMTYGRLFLLSWQRAIYLSTLWDGHVQDGGQQTVVFSSVQTVRQTNGQAIEVSHLLR